MLPAFHHPSQASWFLVFLSSLSHLFSLLTCSTPAFFLRQTNSKVCVRSTLQSTSKHSSLPVTWAPCHYRATLLYFQPCHCCHAVPSVWKTVLCAPDWQNPGTHKAWVHSCLPYETFHHSLGSSVSLLPLFHVGFCMRPKSVFAISIVSFGLHHLLILLCTLTPGVGHKHTVWAIPELCTENPS